MHNADFRVLLDETVLLSPCKRDSLLRFAELDAYRLVLSDAVLDRTKELLIKIFELSDANAESIRSTIAAAFPEAMVPASQVSALIPIMPDSTISPGVLATAVGGCAALCVTNRPSKYPKDFCEIFDIDLKTEDAFLCSLFDLDPELAKEAIESQAASLTRPPKTVKNVVDSLEHTGAPEFAKRLRLIFDV